MHLNPNFAVVFALLLATSTLTEAKHSRPSSSETSNHEHIKLTYGQNHNPARKPAEPGSNVPSNNKLQGPPPAYSHSNPAGGAKVNEKPPAYNPDYAPAPNSNTTYRHGTGTAAGTAHNGSAYQPKQNRTGEFGRNQQTRLSNQTSPSNPAGGAKVDPYEKPPAYNPGNATHHPQKPASSGPGLGTGVSPAAQPGSDIVRAPLAPILPVPNTNGTKGTPPLAQKSGAGSLQALIPTTFLALILILLILILLILILLIVFKIKFCI